MFRQDILSTQELPPKMFMMQIIDDLPKVYCFLWEKKDLDYQINLTWKDVAKCYNKNNFRTCVRKLNNKGLLEYTESDQGVHIELTGWDDIANA